MRSSWAPTISQVIKPTKTTYRRLINIVLLLLLLLKQIFTQLFNY